MEFGILGPLEVRCDGRERPIAGAKQRALLAVLLLNVNHVVSSDRLVAELWGGEPPESGQAALRVRVSQLRKVLEPGCPARPQERSRARWTCCASGGWPMRDRARLPRGTRRLPA